MTLYVNERNEIKDVGSTNQSGLIELTVSDVDNPFADWSIAKMCCYKVQVMNEHIVSYTPYVNSIIIDQLDKIGQGTESNVIDVSDLRNAIIEIYEMIESVV